MRLMTYAVIRHKSDSLFNVLVSRAGTRGPVVPTEPQRPSGGRSTRVPFPVDMSLVYLFKIFYGVHKNDEDPFERVLCRDSLTHGDDHIRTVRMAVLLLCLSGRARDPLGRRTHRHS
jgi:hypothetical protein